jgi:syntaxin 1B/2/3
MIVDMFEKAKALDSDIGRRAREYQPDKRQDKNEKVVAEFMVKKDKTLRYLNDIEQNIQVLKELRKQYQEAMDSNIESGLLGKMNTYNEKNAHMLREITKILQEMKDQAKIFKNSAALKNEPEGRIMNGLNNAIQTKMYQVLQKSQLIQVDIKDTVKAKISRQVSTADPSLTDEQIANMIDDPEAVQDVLQSKIFAAAHGQVRNAIEDVNKSYQELGKLEKNVKQLFEMIQDLSIIVKNQTNILNSIEENLKQTKNYIHKAEVNLQEAKKQYMEGNERLCCIAVCLVFIALAVLWPIMSIIG